MLLIVPFLNHFAIILINKSKMDPNLKKTIQDHKEKSRHSAPTVDCVELERWLREFKTELYIKRDEVNQLRTELDAANLEMQNLRKALDVTKRALDESRFNLNLQLKKARNNEEPLEKRESLMKIQLQHKMAITEIDTLKENLQKMEMEKAELSRKVDVLETKQRHNSLYQNEILERNNQLRNFMRNINEQAIKLQSQHVQTVELSKETQLANEALEKLKYCAEENEKLKKAKEQFEEMYIKVNAKYEKLEELMKLNSSVNKPNLLTRTVFNQWKLSMVQNEVQTQQRNEILNKMTQSLTEEKNVNIKLITENENIKEKNKELKDENLKLENICKEHVENINILKTNIKLLEDSHLMKESTTVANPEYCMKQIKEETVVID